MSKFLSWFRPGFSRALVYMLQASEYDSSEFLVWFWRATDIRQVARRGRLDLTTKAKLLLWFARGVVTVEVLGVLALVLWNFDNPPGLIIAVALVLISPLITVFALVTALWLGRVTIQNRRERAIITRAKRQLDQSTAFRIGIAGSYGKTSFKEMLAAILSDGKKVAATPGNMNTPLGISRFIEHLAGDEEVLIFELGEYYPGDIAALCQLVRPQLGVLTGINEAHLSKFKTIDRTTATIFELADYLGDQPAYKNGDNALIKDHVNNDDLLYSANGVNGWAVSKIEIGLDSTSFTASRGRHTIHAKSGLLGRQQVGPLAACIDIADRLGLTPAQITAGIAATKPYDHRMQPRQLGGAWIIDDTYNGNSDGVAAGLDWLAAVPAVRRVYVTPGLVEQGGQTEAVHVAIGRHIATVADVVVLMQNSVKPFIERGLREANFDGTLTVVTDPVKFYTGLDQFVAAGDVVLMQNDWTDNYA